MPGSKMESLGSLQQFKEVLAGKVNEVPQLAVSVDIFSVMVEQTHDLAQKQAELTAAKQDATQQFQDQLSEAQRMATALRAALKVHYGPDSEKLVEFGIQPFRGKKRKRKEPPAPPPVEQQPEE